MDLRPFIKDKQQVQSAIKLIRKGDLFYQPFIIADDIEVGEGQNLADNYADAKSPFDCNAYFPGEGKGKRPASLEYFRKCNQGYRAIYDHYADTICAQFGNDISKTTFAEIGCNTGLNLFNLAKRGAKQCTGYDWNDMSGVFSWLNGVLGTRVRFRRGVYSNLQHRFSGFDMPEVDVMINTIFLHHQCDPLQFLSYMCDRARKGVFLAALTAKDDSCAVHYPAEPDPNDVLEKNRPFPLYFYNGVIVSEKLLRLSFSRLGFGDVRRIETFIPDEKWRSFQTKFTVYYATRTGSEKSAYSRKILPRLKRRIRRMLSKK